VSKRKTTLALLLTLALLCAGCGQQEARAKEGTLSLYWPAGEGSPDGSALTTELWTGDGEPTAQSLMEGLLAGPKTEGLTSPFPRRTSLRSCRVEEGVAKIDLSEAYDGLSGVDLSLADGCIVLTLCQLPEVEAVYLTVGGHPRPFRDQILSPDDLLLDNGGGRQGTLETVLWFLDREGLAWEDRTLTLAIGDDPAHAVLQALLAGPDSGLLTPVCPPDTKLLSLRGGEGRYEVDLSAAFLDAEPDPRRLQAMANTLAQLDGEAAVTFTVQGEPLEHYGGLDLTEPVQGVVREGT